MKPANYIYAFGDELFVGDASDGGLRKGVPG